MALRTCRIFNLIPSGHQDYLKVWKYQKSLMDSAWLKRKQEQETTDSLLFVQHSNVYTLGRGADRLKNLKFDPKLTPDRTIYTIERGGEVTWHGPGQLVCYPIIDLNHHKRDLHWYVKTLEEAVIRSLANYGVKATRSDLNPGVWVNLNDPFLVSNSSQTSLSTDDDIVEVSATAVNQVKICSIGITASRWITMHGLAINLTSDLRQILDFIVPCGIQSTDGGVCTLKGLLESHARPSDSISLNIFQEQLQKELVSLFSFGSVHVEEKPEEYLDDLVREILKDQVPFPTRFLGEN